MINRTLQLTLCISILTISFSTHPVLGYTSGNAQLKDAFDVALTTIIDSGDFDEIFADWFTGSVVLVDDTDANTATVYPSDPEGTLANVIEAGEIVFGAELAYPPFEYIESGVTKGFTIDLANAICALLSTEYDATIVARFVNSDWDPIIPNLLAGEFDAIFSSMVKTPARALKIDFTRGYYTSSQGILQGAAYTGSTIDDVSDLNDTSITIGLLSGTISDLYALDHITNYDTRVTAYPTFDLVITAIEADDVDVILGDASVLKFYEAQIPGTEFVATFLDENFGIGVRKDVDQTSTTTTTTTSTTEGITSSSDVLTTSSTNLDTTTKQTTSLGTPDLNFPLGILPLFSSLLIVSHFIRKNHRK
ncbi:MAG: transporter substrate-binding domain-containing protein [Candidatus Kariarchaeaceae archaeon]|jgi:polar amino acid transport system substrate-binding protein